MRRYIKVILSRLNRWLKSKDYKKRLEILEDLMFMQTQAMASLPFQVKARKQAIENAHKRRYG